MATRHEGSAVGFTSDRGPVLIAIMLSTALVAMDSTIVATAVPSIVDDLHGFAQFPWLFSVYLLAQAVTVPIYSKLADQFGRKPVMLFGIGLFITGSILGGAAWSMPVLIIFRGLQGLGAGAVQPMAQTIAGDIYTVAERARIQGYLSSVWGIAAIIGPAIGGVLSQYASWRWIFYVNVPLCIVAVVILMRGLHEDVVKVRHRVDYLGAGLLTAGLALLILGLLEGGQAWPWVSPPGITVFVLGVALLAAFTVAERHAAEPVLPLWVFRRRLLVGSSLTAVALGAALIGLSSYVPTFVQRSLGHDAVIAGFTVAVLSIGWPIASALCGRLYMRIGFRATALIGALIVVTGSALTLPLGLHSQVWQVAVCCLVIGAGMGLSSTPALVAAQSSVGWEQRGMVTGTNMFGRNLGSAVGVAVFGAVVNNALGGAANPGGAAVAAATHDLFIGVLVVSVGMVAAVLLMPGGDVPTRTPRPASPA